MANQPKGIKEFIRKRLVALKRKPQTIALLAFALAFVYYSLNLTKISDTTAYINLPGMGLAGFATMLFSILMLVCFLNAFPHRKKVNVPMLCLMLLMVGIIIFCGAYYQGRITAKLRGWADYKPGDTVLLSFKRKHFFDKETTNAIRKGDR